MDKQPQQKQKRERPPSIGDFIGKKVRITYYYRDSTNATGKRNVFDRDEIIEGVVKYYTHRSEFSFPFNGPVSVCGCVELNDGTLKYKFLPLDGPLICRGYSGHTPSGVDGKRNGSYNVELLG